MPKKESLIQSLKFTPEEQIVGFSYSFSKALYEFLDEQCRAESLYITKDEEREARRNDTAACGILRPEVRTAICYLADQMQVSSPESFAAISGLLYHTESFLAIFEEK